MVAIADLVALGAAPADDDLLVIRDVSASSDNDKKITILNLFANLVKNGASATLTSLTVTNATVTSATCGTISFATSLTFTGGATVTSILTATSSITVPSMAAGTGGTETMTVAGVATGDHVAVSSTAAWPAGVFVTGRVTATDQVTLSFFNASGVTAGGSAQDIRVVVSRFS